MWNLKVSRILPAPWELFFIMEKQTWDLQSYFTQLESEAQKVKVALLKTTWHASIGSGLRRF